MLYFLWSLPFFFRNLVFFSRKVKFNHFLKILNLWLFDIFETFLCQIGDFLWRIETMCDALFALLSCLVKICSWFWFKVQLFWLYYYANVTFLFEKTIKIWSIGINTNDFYVKSFDTCGLTVIFRPIFPSQSIPGLLLPLWRDHSRVFILPHLGWFNAIFMLASNRFSFGYKW